ncbi:hypothetical protein jhhlp_003913 [Lomentospora prolificans]|uniref:Dol-P-Man:Man(5)GlcNAc(2)-PP-Dol alpha-1,3-mannosyltransferase n=1 Tax=Lomentospora prolificans TaxID=41688 RepID=A0A2N3NA32_9PEZI|nr:hypothetical protein jhhlp_003913 [Lomentospora prolificans]
MDRQQPPVYVRVYRLGMDIANGRHALSRLVAPLLWIFDMALCALVIWKVPYTEIDWVAYMEQVKQFLDGERNYVRIEGGTGPLVYPAAHVYTYTALYRITNNGENILLAQQIFAGLYLATLALVMACYKKANAPPYILPLLVLSKRLHSVFMLRCFNDCFAAFFLWLAIFLLQRRLWTFGTIAYSWGLGIKMSLLLALPAVAVILFLGRGFYGSLRLAMLMLETQIAVAIPFLMHDSRAYLGRAFELTRQFKYEWTVNMRILSEETFLSKELAATLLVFHAADLFSFITGRWLAPTRQSLWEIVPSLLRGKSPFTEKEEAAVSLGVSPRFVLTTILAAMNMGMLFARSLHYQFYAYLAWSTPFLLWNAGLHPVIIYVVWAMQEWAWNVFPSTPASSAIVVFAMLFADRVTWMWGYRAGEKPRMTAARDSAKPKQGR